MERTICETAYLVKANPHTVRAYSLWMGQSLQKIVATNVKAARMASGLTQPEVAAAAKTRGYTLDQGTISRIERGELRPSVDVLEAVSKGLNVEAWQLMIPNLDPRNPPMLRAVSDKERALWKHIQDSAKGLGLTE